MLDGQLGDSGKAHRWHGRELAPGPVLVNGGDRAADPPGFQSRRSKRSLWSMHGRNTARTARPAPLGPARRPGLAGVLLGAGVGPGAGLVTTPGGAEARPGLAPPASEPRWVRGMALLRATAVGLVGANVAVTLSATPATGPTAAPASRDALYGLSLVACAVLALVGATQRRPGRRGWLLVAGSQVAWALGELAWAFDAHRGGTSPGVTLGDVGRASSYLLAGAGLVCLARGQVDRFRPGALLDALSGGLAVAAAGAAWQLVRIGQGGEGGRLALVLDVMHPAADLLLLCLVVSSMGLAGWRLGRGWLWLAAGFGLAGLTDTARAMAVADGRYREGTVLHVGWLLAALCIAVACAARPAEPGGRPGRGRMALRLAVPALFTSLALAVLVGAALGGTSGLGGTSALGGTSGDAGGTAVGGLDPGSDAGLDLGVVGVGLAAAALVVVGLRLSLTFHQLHALADGQELARTDELTGLGNRRLLLERLDRALDERIAPPRLALLLGDLDHFKVVNDSFGHQAGDRLLVDLAARLLDCLRDGELLCRLGGDEFAVLVPEGGRHRSEELARRLRAAAAQPFDVPGASVTVELSIGIALAPEHAEEPATLLQRADLAMYAAKRQRAGQRLFDLRLVQASAERPDPAVGLRLAVRERALEVHYQPKMSLARGSPVGVEALVRWRHPDRGVLYPPAFLLPHVVEPDRAREVTALVVADALAACARWSSTGVPLPVAVNVSAADLEDDDLARGLIAGLDLHRLPPELITLEVTETTLMNDPQRARRALADLRTLGLRVSLDDYGTGLSSLTHLRDFPLDELKLDRTFVAALSDQPVTRALMRSTIELAHTLGLTVVAEGVERSSELSSLHELGCDHGQGYLWSPALPSQEVLAWVAGRRGPGHTSPAGPRVGAPGAR